MFFEKMQTRKNDGFTLVELIVVIAILAILAGIAVPAYSGYIEKANVAADEQLLHAVNIAFLSAAAEHADGTVSNASLSYGGSTGAVTVTGVASVTSSGAPDLNALKTAFATYYGDNNAAAFKTVTSLMYDSAKHMFVNPNTAESLTLAYGGGYITISGEALDALKNSTFLNADTLGGSDGLLDQIDYVTQIAAGMAGDLKAVFADDSFVQCAMTMLGATTQEEYTAKQETMIQSIMANNPGLTFDQAKDQLSANAAVLYAAQSAVNFTDAQVSELFAPNGTGIEAIKNNLKGNNTTDGMAQAALVYGMYTAYANSEKYGTAELQATTNNPLAVLNALEKDADFKTYVSSEQGQQDLDAYLAALDMINNGASSNPTAVEHLMINGFNNDELKALVAGATGK